MNLKQFAAENEEKVGYMKLNDGDNVVTFKDDGEYYVDDHFSTPEKEVNGFRFIAEDQYGAVGELKVTSKRLLRALAAYDGLAENTFVITRSGTGMSTMYAVKPYNGSNAVVDPTISAEGKPMGSAEMKEMGVKDPGLLTEEEQKNTFF